MIVMPCVGRMRVSGDCRWCSLRRAASQVGRAGALGAFLCALLLPPKAFAIGQERYVEFAPRTTSFVIARGETLANIYVDRNEWPGVVRAAKDLQADVERVTGRIPGLTQAEDGAGANAILVGTLGKSGVIDRLAQEGKLDVQVVKGKWESFVIQVVPQPLPVSAFSLLMAQRSVSGSPSGAPATVARMLEFAARHSIAPVVEEFPMSQVNQAFAHLEAGKARYRIVLKNDLE